MHFADKQFRNGGHLLPNLPLPLLACINPIPLFPYSLIPSSPHSLIPLFPYSLIPLFPHSLIPLFPHSLIPSPPHPHAGGHWPPLRTLIPCPLLPVSPLSTLQTPLFTYSLNPLFPTPCSLSPVPCPLLPVPCPTKKGRGFPQPKFSHSLMPCRRSRARR